jgi:hypothetical protein
VALGNSLIYTSRRNDMIDMATTKQESYEIRDEISENMIDEGIIVPKEENQAEKTFEAMDEVPEKMVDTLSLKNDKTGAIGLIVGVILVLIVLAFFGIFGLHL